MSVTMYHYPNCSTCKKALKWLDAHDVAYDKIDIVKTPPSAKTLKQAQALADAPLKKLFNTSGMSYRGGGWKDKIGSISDADAYAALAADGKLIKRPLLIGEDFALIGFKEPAYAERLG